MKGWKTALNRLSRAKYFNRWIIFLLDLLLSTACTGAALLFIAATFPITFPWGAVASILLFSALCSAISIVCLQIYKGIIRHSSFMEAGRIGMASLLKVLLLVAII